MNVAPKCPQTTAHPRVSGENRWDPLHSCKTGGSSPRERGKRPKKVEQTLEVRLIPA